MTVISHTMLRGKLHRIEEKSGAKVKRWAIHLEDGQPPSLHIRLLRDGADHYEFLTLPLADVCKYEDDEFLCLGGYPNPLGMGATDTDGS